MSNQVSVVRMKKIEADSSLKAFADVLFFNSIIVTGCKVFSGTKGIFASLPQSKGKEDKWWPIVKIKDEALRDEFQTVMLEAYKKGVTASPADDSEVPF